MFHLNIYMNSNVFVMLHITANNWNFLTRYVWIETAKGSEANKIKWSSRHLISDLWCCADIARYASFANFASHSLFSLSRVSLNKRFSVSVYLHTYTQTHTCWWVLRWCLVGKVLRLASKINYLSPFIKHLVSLVEVFSFAVGCWLLLKRIECVKRRLS